MTLLASLVGTLIFHCLIKHFDLNLRAKLRSNAALLFAKKTQQSLSNLCDSYSLLDIYELRFFLKYTGITDEPASLKNRTTCVNFLCFKILTLNKFFPICSLARVLYDPFGTIHLRRGQIFTFCSVQTKVRTVH